MQTPSKESQLILAIEAMKQDPDLSSRRAATIYNIPRSTLRTQQLGVINRRESPPNSAKLTELEEKTIVEYILDLDARCYPPRLSEVRDMANRLIEDRGASRVGATGFYVPPFVVVAGKYHLLI